MITSRVALISCITGHVLGNYLFHTKMFICGRKGEGRKGREREKGREGIGEGEEGKENGDRPSTIFGLKVAMSGRLASRRAARKILAEAQPAQGH